MRDDALDDLEAVSPRRTTQILRVVAGVVSPRIELPVNVNPHLVSLIPRANVADSEPHHHLVMVERETSESFLNEVAGRVLTRQSVLITDLGARLAGEVAAQIHGVVFELIKSDLVLGFGLTDPARVPLQQVEAGSARPALIRVGTVTGPNIVSAQGRAEDFNCGVVRAVRDRETTHEDDNNFSTKFVQNWAHLFDFTL